MSFSWKNDWWLVVGALALGGAAALDVRNAAKKPAADTSPSATTPPPVPEVKSFRPAPDGYWYIVAYEQQAPGTIGGTTWSRYSYYDGRPHAGTDAASIALGAQFSHTKPLTPGAVRAWWWNGIGWDPWPEFARNW